MKTYLILIIGIFTYTPVLSIAQQTCKEVSFNHLQSTEAGFCFECLTQRVTAQPLFIPTLSCFKQSVSARKTPIPPSKNTFCENSSLQEGTSSIPMCASNQYIKTTARVFHEVSQCLNIKDPSFFFALINRESRFQIAAESGTGASCYGQLTGIAITDINKRFLPAKINDPNKCTAITENWEPLSTTAGNRKTDKTICTLHSNPYSCLFYSALYYLHSLEEAKKIVEDLDIVTVRLDSNPKNLLIFKGKKDFESHRANNQEEFKEIKEIKYISIFQDKKLITQTIALQGYNGGPEMIKNQLKNYANTIKGTLWSETETSLSRTYKQAIFNKKPYGIPTSDFIETFGKYVENHRSQEAGVFAKKVLQDFYDITKNNPSCGDIPRNINKPKNQFKAQNMI